ncbi:hypothetical protein [Comamonas sp. B21-038]|uniref:hypothetical protein n=1 Tax=Comamonas sp. B21-038 TaxID=2918299 RepID=UPI001EFBAF50|nr:hypothetical protein [Comamonas sp. B21-038]ULR87422.1 hypothetical protein MJ205_13200 [Comamonas sp. B21-038]
MNAFSKRNESLATQLTKPRILKTVDRNPRYHGYYIESGAQAQASTLKTQRILKGALR